MKITLDIPAKLLREARKIAAREGTTLHALIEQGLRQVIVERRRTTGFRLRKAGFKGRGLQPQCRNAVWGQLLAASYEGRGE